jgi:hypothetical protein
VFEGVKRPVLRTADASGVAPPVARRLPSRTVSAALVVAALAGLGAWLTASRSGGSGAGRAASPPGTGLTGPSAAPPAGTPLPTAPEFARVDWSRVTYPLACGGIPTTVVAVSGGDVGADGVPDAAVAVRCDAGAGSPPTELYVYAPPGAGDSSPRRLATLVEQTDDVLLTTVAVDASGVRATGYAYSSARVPRCCPDERVDVRWARDDVRFVRRTA